MEDNRTLKLIIGALALVLVLGGGCLCLSFAGLVSFASEDIDNEIVATREGTEFGQTHTTDECIHEGYRRSSECSDLEPLCINTAKDFLGSCLGAVPTPDNTVCDGAPASPGLLPDETYATTVGSRYGWDGLTDGPAGDVISALELHCALHR